MRRTAQHRLAYLASIESLATTVREGEPHRAESKKALRDLISTVTDYNAPAGVTPDIEVTGPLTNLIGGDHFPTSKAVGGRMVAGEGLEPRHADYDASRDR